MGDSLLLHPIQVRPGQLEGYAYLGAGVLLLAVAVFVVRLVRHPGGIWPVARQHLPLIVLVIVAFLFSLATPIRVGPHALFSLSWLYDPFSDLTGIFRSSGRFTWPLVYPLMLAIIGYLAVSMRQRSAAILFAVALLVQGIDLLPLYECTAQRSAPTNWPRLRSPFWKMLAEQHDAIAMLPTFHPIPNTCMKRRRQPDVWIPFAHLAVTHGLRTDSANVARLPSAELLQVCRKRLKRLREGQVDDRTFYVVDDQYLSTFRWWTGDRLSCWRVDGFAVCSEARFETVPSAMPVRGVPLLRADLRRRPGKPPVVARVIGGERSTPRGVRFADGTGVVLLNDSLDGDGELRVSFAAPLTTQVRATIDGQTVELEISTDRLAARGRFVDLGDARQVLLSTATTATAAVTAAVDNAPAPTVQLVVAWMEWLR